MEHSTQAPSGLPSVYDPRQVEGRWYPLWESAGLFGARPEGGGPAHAIVIPPPNVTGSLHMGHALNNTLQDVLTRWRRMQGLSALWVPGTDHGGIATQNVVEKIIKKEGVNRRDLGREKFLERMWAWRRESGDTILMQLKRLGCALDWSRTRFTMDESCSRAVLTAFVELHRQGLLYRGKRLVNWCPRCITALADIEVEHEDRKGRLWHIRYPMASGPRGGKGAPPAHVVVATTRPETLLGDTAVAVNPRDRRYKALVGSTLTLPLMNRAIPVVADAAVEAGFGTGAVKVTPSHDPADFEIASRHNLPHISVIGFDGRMTEEAGPYAGLERFAAREKVVADLEALGLIEKIEDHALAAVVCYRCGTVLEPLESEQWFLSVGGMAKKALAASRQGQVKIVPRSWARPYALWLRNIKDWCVSRQIWWGHRIPAWYCRSGASQCPPIVQADPPLKCPSCGGAALEQDADVLDTWFSSALWPFSVFGWPQKSPDLARFYPTSVLVTGHEILYLWVARMVMMGLHFLNQVPFRHVFIHGIVRDKQGRKMSKSLGNVIDPLEVIEKVGTDALRFCLISSAAPGRDMQLAQDGFLGARNFCNKIWNAFRFAAGSLGTGRAGPPAPESGSRDLPALGAWLKENSRFLSLADRWILSRFQGAAKEATRALERFDLDQAARRLYDFFWSEFCDWYLEMSKCRLNPQMRRELELGDPDENSMEATRATLLYVLDGCLRLLHPLMPFLTEELWQKLPPPSAFGRQTAGDLRQDSGATGPGGSADRRPFLLEAAWPVPDGRLADARAEKQMALLQETVTALRTVRSEMNVPPQTKIEVQVKPAPGSALPRLLEEQLPVLKLLARVSRVRVEPEAARPPSSALAVVPGAELFVPLSGLIDFSREKVRLSRESEEINGEVERFRRKLANEDFLSHADAEEVAKTRERFQQATEKLERIQANLALLDGGGAV